MAHTFEELKKKTVEELREIAAGIQHEAVQGHTQMFKSTGWCCQTNPRMRPVLARGFKAVRKIYVHAGYA